MDGRPTWTDCDEAGDYVVPNVLSPRDLVFRPDNMDETVPHTHILSFFQLQSSVELAKEYEHAVSATWAFTHSHITSIISHNVCMYVLVIFVAFVCIIRKPNLTL